jgi:hypothetical protein
MNGKIFRELATSYDSVQVKGHHGGREKGVEIVEISGWREALSGISPTEGRACGFLLSSEFRLN